MFGKEKKKNQGGKWLGEEERNEEREDVNIVFTFFKLQFLLMRGIFGFYIC